MNLLPSSARRSRECARARLWYRAGVADVSWSAYALAMFTPEQRAAAVNAVYEPPDDLKPIPPPVPPASAGSIGFLVQVGSRLLNPNKPGELAEIHAAGWRYEGGRWIAPGAAGVAATPDQVAATGGRVGLSSVAPVSFIPGGSVLGTSVPLAPPVLLPSFVGGRLGDIRMGGGMRPDAGGTPKRIVMGPGRSAFPAIRMGVANWGR